MRNSSLLLFLVLAGVPSPSNAAECSSAGDLSALEELLSGFESLMQALDVFFPTFRPAPAPWMESSPGPVAQVRELVENIPLLEPAPARGMSSTDAHVWQFYGTPLDCGPASALIISRLLGLESDNDSVGNDDPMAWTPDGSNGRDASAGLSSHARAHGRGRHGHDLLFPGQPGALGAGGRFHAGGW
jgi:hypothetical protein